MKRSETVQRILVVLRSGDEAWILEWSTVSDAPASWGTPVADAGNNDKVAFALKYGTWSPTPSSVDDGMTGEQYTLYNRAGEDETLLSREQIINSYCRQHRQPPLRGFAAHRQPGISDSDRDAHMCLHLLGLESENAKLGYDKAPNITPTSKKLTKTETDH